MLTIHTDRLHPKDVSEKPSVRVLLVEDSRSDVVLTTRILRDISSDEPFHVTDVPRVADALRLMDKRSFDIILLDLDLPQMSGIAGIAALRAEAPNVPIIIYSASSNPDMKNQALMCGARHYVTKGRESAFALQHIMEQSLLAGEICETV